MLGIDSRKWKTKKVKTKSRNKIVQKFGGKFDNEVGKQVPDLGVEYVILCLEVLRFIKFKSIKT